MENAIADCIGPINNLPNEVLTMILSKCNYRDIVQFGSTCSRFNDLINTDQILWREQFKYIVSAEVAEILEQNCDKNCDPDWYGEVKRYYNVRKQIYSEIKSMSSKYFWRTTDISLEDVRNFFVIALSHNLNYHYTLCILRGIIKKCKKNLERCINEKPYTLTEMYYAKVALRHLKHTFLTLKWVKLHLKNELDPEMVINFFLQWIDTDNSFPDDKVRYKIEELTKKVELVLDEMHPTKVAKSAANRGIKYADEPEIISAITNVIYKQRHMAVTSTASLDTLNIIKVIETRCGNAIVVGAVFYAIAKMFAVHCDLVAFPNHLFLQWLDSSDRRNPLCYTIDLSTGVMHPKRRCPFSQGRHVEMNHRYSPDSLLQYIYSSFHMTMGAIKNWQTQNALHLLDFLGTDDNDFNPYRNFLGYLLDLSHIPSMDIPLDIQYLNEEHMEILKTLSNLNTPLDVVERNVTVKHHDGRVKYAVGMICFHKKYDYVSIIRGWDLTCAIEWQNRVEIDNLEFGSNQPFYYVIVADQSERYVAQENLIEVAKPTRLYHLEDLISKEFTHFDGFAYMLNDEKRKEYPDDDSIANAYRDHFEHNIRT